MKVVTNSASEVRLSQILPPAEGPSEQISVRIPKLLLERIEKIAKDTEHHRSDVIVHFLRWASQEWANEQQKKPVAKTR